MTTHGMRRFRQAFTLVEMLVVITIIVIIIVIALPSFSAMLDSSEKALAKNMLTSAMQSARNAAIKSDAGQDAAAVFTYDPTTGRTTILTCLKIGTLRDYDPSDPTNDQAYVLRDVFAPSRDAAAVFLPRGWMVRAYVPKGFIPGNSNDSDLWYSDRFPSGIFPRYNPANGNWVFPESHFYDPSSPSGGLTRSTFMVRFHAGSGLIDFSDWTPALVIDPSKDDSWRESVVSNAVQKQAFILSFDLTTVADTQTYAQRVLNASPSVMTNVGKRTLIGRINPDMILTRPISMIALYKETSLANGIDVRLDRDSRCLYKAPQYMLSRLSTGDVNEPRYVADVDQDKINSWIQGDVNFDGVVAGTGFALPDIPEAQLFAIDRYSGSLLEIFATPASAGGTP